MKNIFAIAKNTFRETSRDRILLSALFVIIAIILFSLFIGTLSFDQSTRIIVDFGVTAIYSLQVFVAIFIGSMLMYKEIERKTFFLIIPKPVSRTEIVIGKCLGLSATTVLVTAISTLALFAILFIQGGKLYIWPITLSVILSSLEAVLLILISIIFSGITSPVLAAVSTITFYLLGHSQDVFRYIFMTTLSPVIEYSTKILYYFLPNFEKFNIRNDIVYGTMPTPFVLVTTLIYAIICAALLLLIAHLTFKKKEF